MPRERDAGENIFSSRTAHGLSITAVSEREEGFKKRAIPRRHRLNPAVTARVHGFHSVACIYVLAAGDDRHNDGTPSPLRRGKLERSIAIIFPFVIRPLGRCSRREIFDPSSKSIVPRRLGIFSASSMGNKPCLNFCLTQSACELSRNCVCLVLPEHVYGNSNGIHLGSTRVSLRSLRVSLSLYAR